MKFKIKMFICMFLLGVVFMVGCVEESVLPDNIQNNGNDQLFWNKESCANLSHRIQDTIDSLNKSCNEDSDCTNVFLGCPIECYNPTNNDADSTEVKDKWAIYKQNCSPCVYKCPTKNIKCLENKCQAINTTK